jgi:hypothetical protein
MTNSEIIGQWQSLSSDASEDNLVCEIIISNTTIENWKEFLEFINKTTSFKYLLHGTISLLPENISNSFFQTESFNSLTINIDDSIAIDCPILGVEMIEMNLNPSLVTKAHQIEILINFIQKVSDLLSKNVLITLEGAIKPYIVISPTHNIF